MSLKVLVTGAGGPSAISFMKSFWADNILFNHEEVDFYAGDIDVNAAGLYLVDENRRVILLPAKHPDFIPNLKTFCFENEIDVLVPTVDDELLAIAEERGVFSTYGTKILLTSKESLEICLDKYKLLRVCEHTVPVPRFAVFDETFNADGWEFPLFIKPRCGAGSRGIMKIETPEKLAETQRNHELLIQEFLPGEEYSVDVLVCKEGTVIAAVPRERLKIDSGIAVAARTLFDKDLEEFSRQVAVQVGLTYTVNIQFRRDKNGLPRLLEVNPRFPGTMPLTVASGVNMPVLSLEHLLGRELTRVSGEFKELAMVRYWQEKFVGIDEMNALKSAELESKTIEHIEIKSVSV
jgi:carbamoyl-phosphate synthase large subunit